MLLHTTEDEMLMLGKALLTLFRDVFRNTRLDADDMVEMLCSDSEESEEDKRMSEALETLKIKVYNFPDYGPDFVSILNLTYLNTFKYSIEEIEETTCLSRATIYRHKKRAIIMFGLAFLEYKKDYMMTDPLTFGYTGEQLQFDFFRPAMSRN